MLEVILWVPRTGELRAEFGVAGNAGVIGRVGRYHEEKDHDLLVEAATIRPRAWLPLVGAGPLYDRVCTDRTARWG